MRLYASQFQRTLDKIASHYILFGKEPSLIQMNSDKLNALLKAKGYEREFILIDNANQFDWSTLLMQATSPSLFNPQRFFDIYLPNAKIKANGAQVLLKLASLPDPNTIWILRTNEADAATQKSAWWRAWETLGVAVQHPQLNTDTFLQWILQYSQSHGLTLTRDCALFLCDRYQGNLAAAKQTLDMLGLTFEGKPVTLSELNTHFADQSLFSIFEVCDFALQGHTKEVIKGFDVLATTPAEFPLLIWALNKMLNELATLLSQPEAFEKLSIWSSRRPYYYHAAKRLSYSDCLHLLQGLFRCDANLKSGEKGAACHFLLDVLLHLSGKKAIDFEAIF